MFLIARTHCTDQEASDVPNVFVLKLDEQIIKHLLTYAEAAKKVDDMVKDLGGSVAGVAFDFLGEFLQVPERSLELLGLGDEEDPMECLLFDALELDIFKKIAESDEITCKQVRVWPEGGLYFGCLLDTKGLLVETDQIHINTFLGEPDDRSDATTN